MVLCWRSYQTDLDRAYPMFALSIRQINEVVSEFNPLSNLPNSISQLLIEVNNPCAVGGLTPRQLALFASDGGQFLLSYPQPFNQALFDYLTANIQVVAFEFIGERLRYGRLRRLLENV